MAKMRPIVIGRTMTPEDVATLIRESATYAEAGALLNRTPEQVKQLAWRLRESGEDCGILRTAEWRRRRNEAAKESQDGV